MKNQNSQICAPKKLCFTISSHDAEMKTSYLRLIVGWLVGWCWSRWVLWASECRFLSFLLLHIAAVRSSWMMSIFFHSFCLAGHFPSVWVSEWVNERPNRHTSAALRKHKTKLLTVCIVKQQVFIRPRHDAKPIETGVEKDSQKNLMRKKI